MLPCVRNAWRASLPRRRATASATPSSWHPHGLQPAPRPHSPDAAHPPAGSPPHVRPSSSSSSAAGVETATAATSGHPDPAGAAAAAAVGDDWQQRTRLLVGDAGIAALASTRVLLVGLGGVGSFAGEFLARAGVGELTIVDGDVVDSSNRNRQLPALTSTIGQSKAALMEARLLDINPGLHLTVRHEFLHPDTSQHLVAAAPYDFVLDCIDSIAPKVHLIAAAHTRGIHVVSSMGAGGRRDPSAVRVADISETFNDRFAAEVRRSLRRRHGIRSGVAAVFSSELAAKASMNLVDGNRYKKSYYGTISYIPALFGLNMAAHVVNTVLQGVDQPTPEAHGGNGNGLSHLTGSSTAASTAPGSGEGRNPAALRFEDVSGVGMGFDGSCI